MKTYELTFSQRIYGIITVRACSEEEAFKLGSVANLDIDTDDMENEEWEFVKIEEADQGFSDPKETGKRDHWEPLSIKQIEGDE